MEYTREIIENFVKEWTLNKIDKNFVFRENQLEKIVDIISNILEHNNHHHIVEAPTGTGKSLIIIISAGVLAEYFDVTSYLLVSDLTLWDQYEDFLKKHPKTKIAYLKGQIGNYKCAKNGEDITLADCKLAGLGWRSLYNPNVVNKFGFHCAGTCEYVQSRKKAVKAKSCLMTYQLFINIFKNFDMDESDPYQFKPHDVLFCDECHNIPNIVEMLSRFTIHNSDFNKILEIYDWAFNNLNSLFSLDDELEYELNKYKEWLEKTPKSYLINELDNIWKIISHNESRKDEDDTAISRYDTILSEFAPVCEAIINYIKELRNRTEKLSKQEMKIYKLADWLLGYIGSLSEYVTIIMEVGKEHQLKTFVDTKPGEPPIVEMRCTKEDFLVYYNLLKYANFKVMLSATIGGYKPFVDNMGFEYMDDLAPRMDVVPSTFDFRESPIHFLNKFKMSYKEKEISFNHLKTIIYSICSTKFKNQRGIIQTGTYQFAKELYNLAPIEIKKRMLLYNGSREKTTMINIHKMSSDTILVGPTLNEGIDLPGDECRFIIIMKVPYPSLGDRYVKEKIKYFPLWYNSHTSNIIIQGIGRGIRYNGDWCVTYIFDACFYNLYNSTIDQYPKELQERIHFI